LGIAPNGEVYLLQSTVLHEQITLHLKRAWIDCLQAELDKLAGTASNFKWKFSLRTEAAVLPSASFEANYAYGVPAAIVQ